MLLCGIQRCYMVRLSQFRNVSNIETNDSWSIDIVVDGKIVFMMM